MKTTAKSLTLFIVSIAFVIASVLLIISYKERNEALAAFEEVAEILSETNIRLTESQNLTQRAITQAEQATKLADEALMVCRKMEERG